MNKYFKGPVLFLVVSLTLMLVPLIPFVPLAQSYNDDNINVFLPFDPPKQKINLVLNGVPLAPPASLFLNQSGRTLISAAELSSLLDLELGWADNEQLQLSRDQVYISFRNGLDTCFKEEQNILLDTVPFKTLTAFFVPLRVVAEEFGFTVDYDSDTRTIFLSVSAPGEVPASTNTDFPLDLGSWGPILPGTDLADLWDDYTVIGGYFTRLNNSPPNRNTNIILACDSINGTIIRPGNIFSFNQVVGPRHRERGYLSASIFVERRVVPGIGGGICQVSSTIYNSALITSLEIVERHPHTLAVNYVPAGYDATVLWGGADFKFRNNRDTDLKVLAAVYDPYVVVLLVEVD